jgi:hypothetical protein
VTGGDAMCENVNEGRWPKITSDRECKEWARARFYEVETLGQRGEPMDEFYRHAPGLWTRGVVFWSSLVAMVALFGLSYHLGGIEGSAATWWSNACQNLAMGFVASLVLMVYADIKDRTSAYYSELVRVLRRRVQVLRTALRDFDGPSMDVAVLNGQYLECVYMSHQAETFCYNVVGFMKYLYERIPYGRTRMKSAITHFEKRQNAVCEIARKIQEEWHKSKMFDRELARACENAVFEFSYSLRELETYVAGDEKKVFSLKYGTRRKFEHDPESEDI